MPKLLPVLTPKERTVIRLLISGTCSSNREIGEALDRSESTIKGCINNIMRKTGQFSRVKLVVWGIRHQTALKIGNK